MPIQCFLRDPIMIVYSNKNIDNDIKSGLRLTQNMIVVEQAVAYYRATATLVLSEATCGGIICHWKIVLNKYCDMLSSRLYCVLTMISIN